MVEVACPIGAGRDAVAAIDADIPVQANHPIGILVCGAAGAKVNARRLFTVEALGMGEGDGRPRALPLLFLDRETNRSK